MAEPDLPPAAFVADRRARLRSLDKLAREPSSPLAVLKTFQRLLAPPGGPRPALEFLTRVRTPLPTGIVLHAAPLLSDRKVPASVRVAAAGQLLAALPDKPESVGPVVRAVTAGVSERRLLERLYRLQSQVHVCETLDRMVADAEKRVRIKCPKCAAKLSRQALVKHLWRKHRLLYENGSVVDPGPAVEGTVAGYIADPEPTRLDDVYLRAEQLFEGVQPAQVHQALLSRVGGTPDDLKQLATAANETGAGLCPACFAAVRSPLAPVPPPLALAGGRLVGDGYTIDATRANTLRITRPGYNTESLPDPRGRLGPRAYAVRAAAPVAAAAVVVPQFFANRLGALFVLSLVSLLTYSAVRLLRSGGPRMNARAIDAAWAELVPQVGRSVTAVRFLTRLCRSSLGAGDPDERAAAVRELVEHGAVLAEKGGAYVPFLAAMSVLRARDGADRGRDFAGPVADLFAPFFRGELPAEYAEAAAECLGGTDTFTDRDAARVRSLLAGVAFDSGLGPADLSALGPVLPHFARLLAGTANWYGLLYEVWRLRGTRPWESVGPAQTVFEFARKSPAGSGRVLTGYPDTLLVAEFDQPFDKVLGLCLVGRRGVTLMERTVADPLVEVSSGTTRSGTPVLTFGPHAIALRRRVPEAVLARLRGWLRFRAERLIPGAERSADAATGDRVRQILYKLGVECPLCRTRSLIRPGELGVPVVR